MRYIYAIILILGQLSSCYGQSVLAGKIIDQENNQPIYGATIYIPELKKGTNTNINGDFSLTLPEGNHKIKVFYVGYETIYQNVNLHKGYNQLDITLKPGIALTEVIIKGSNHNHQIRKLRESPFSLSIIDGVKLRGRAGGLEEVLTKTSGLKIRKTGGVGSQSKISIHGLEGKRVSVYINGFPLNSPDGSFNINDIPIDIIERVEIYKGLVPAEFGGDGLGGAINIVTREDETDLVGFTQEIASYGTSKTLVAVKKMFEKQGIQLGIGGFYNTSDNNYQMTYPIYEVDLPKEKYKKVTRHNDYYSAKMINFSLIFTKLWFDKIEIECPFYKNKKGIQALNFDARSAYTYGTNIMPNFSLEKKNFFIENLDFKMSGVIPIINTHLVDTLQTIKQWDGSINSAKGETPDFILNKSDDKQREVRLKTNLKYKLNPLHSINLNNQFAYSDYLPKDDYMASYLGYDPSAFPSQMISNIVGLTHEFLSKNKKWNNQIFVKLFYLNSKISNIEKLSNQNAKLTPPSTGVSQLYCGFGEGITYKITNGLRMKSSVSKGIRLPDTQELFGDGVNIRPSVNLQPEKSYNATLGVILDKSNVLGFRRIQFDSNLFYSFIRDMISIFPADTKTIFVNLGKAEIKGFDADLKIDFTDHLYAYYNITYQDIRDKLKMKTNDHSIENITYNKQIPNIPLFFYNYGIEYHTEGLFGKDELSRIYIDGSYMGKFNWNFQLSKRADERKKWEIPSSHIISVGIQQSFWKNRISLSAEVDNLFDNEVFMEFKRPLPGRIYKIKLRFNLFKDKLSGGAMGK